MQFFFYDNICGCKVLSVLEVAKDFERILKYCVTVSTSNFFCQKVPLSFVIYYMYFEFCIVRKIMGLFIVIVVLFIVVLLLVYCGKSLIFVEFIGFVLIVV